MPTATAPTATREQLIEVLAALRAAGDTLIQLHEPDSAVGNYFRDIAFRLQDEFFGKDDAEGDDWVDSPLEVAIHSREDELEADALERFTPLRERIQMLRLMAPRYRQLGTINIPFGFVVRCESCGAVSNKDAEGWQPARRVKSEWEGSDLALLCPNCVKAESDAS